MATQRDYPPVLEDENGKRVVLLFTYRTEERGRVVFGEAGPHGRTLFPRLRIPVSIWARVGRPRRLHVEIRPAKVRDIRETLFPWREGKEGQD